MIAIISDVHSNLAALEAVLEDIRARHIERVICLGDTVGYGPQPVECLERIRQFDTVLLGNHDEAIFHSHKTEEFNVRAELAVEWTRKQLSQGPDQESAERLNFLRNLEPLKEVLIDDVPVTLAHGTPRRPLREYIFPRDIRNAEKMRDIFERIRSIGFVGHSHVPGIYTEDLTYTHPSELEFLKIYHFEDGVKTIVNVGSVGQPRDRDPRSCYVTLTDEADAVVFRRVEYDIEQTRQRIYQASGLDNSLGDRLVEGR
ncbi:metallophosphoesterase family protein [bacterium]|nr:metallophosphoesterase family protein [bacterium]